ncbi:cytosolic carboxypeptidase 2-like isoform X28 [Biomphalaria glabrata]|uniref:Cytosolic carboxypeptidase 2-like isoform X28 n=1 Tax=Biomphalaria glabrata TaxID=6526 RepID=A0A9W3BIZ4_BIOGL|nr:cytosolic carboxypeptidase 2-like isoform X28 [Biomphalaria glabrata]
MMPGEDLCDDDYYGINPYESFMKKHLQHYGYYTGRNQNYKHHFKHYEEWEKNYGYTMSSESSEDSDSDTDDDKACDSKLQEDLLKTTQLIYSCGESGKMVPRLREPRSLYALNKELGPQQAARWPADLQVINERIKHIQTIPTEPEPFYKQTGFEKCPMVRGEANGGKVVFSYEANSSFFMKSRVGGSRNGCDQCSISLESENDTTLIFESRFESGNLGKAVQVGERDYELWLRHDLYTNKHTQWFYFRVSNTRADVEYRFTIVNFMKSDSLYNDGMKPVMYSEKEAELNKVGWIRAGNNIKYYKNNLRYEMGKGERYYYSMTWTIQFKHDRDTVYFSHCYPYTYTDLQNYLLDLTNDPIKSRICKQRVLCRTLAGNLVYVITITSASQNPEDMKHKKAVVVTSRVHPGESNSSWMLKGFLDFVTSSSPDAKLLRDSFIFKVVPMLNPDGVIVGNYRCSLTGRDLNRNYKTALKDAYPSVFHTKQMIRKLLLERDVIVYCDLHGHSRRQNVFIYGCEQPHRSNKRFHERIFPSMLNRNTPEKFCYDSCKFKVQKSKEGTGRVVMWNMGIMNSYTMEATFCGSSLGKKKGFHFNQRDFEMMGYHFCDTLLDYCDPDMTKCDQILFELKQKHHMMVLAKMAEKGLQVEDFPEVDMSTDTESSDDGSDSSISDGPPVHLQFTAPKPKKKKLRSKREREKLHKEEARKTTPVQEDKKMRNNQVKPLKPDNGKAMKYSTNIPKRARSLDDRTNSGIPVFVQERFEEKQQKKHEYLEALTAAYINNNIPIVTDPAFVKLDNNYMKALTDSARFQSVFRELDLHRITPKWLQEEASRIYARRAETSVEDILKSSLTHSASSSLARRKHKPHLLEVSAAQQRQTETLSHDRMSSIKTHPNPFDEISEASRAASSDQTSQATVSSVTPVKVVQLQSSDVGSDITTSQQTPQAPKKSGKSFREKSGRKSRKSMRDDEENCMETTKHNSAEEGTPSSAESRKLLSTEHRTLNLNIALDVKAEMVIPKISAKSAKNGRMKSTEITNVQDIKKALTSTNTDLSAEGVSNAGDYIQKLIKDTSEEIKDLTNEIQQDLEKKQLKSREASKMSIVDFKDKQFRENTQFSERTPTASAQLLSSSGSELMSHSSSSISETKKTSSEKNLFPSVLPSPHLVTDSFNHAKLEEITKFSPLDSVKISGEIKLSLVNGKSKDAQEELSRSRSLKRHSSLTSMQSSNNRVPAQGRHSTSQVNNSSGNVDRITHPTFGSVPQKMSRPVLEDPDDGASHRQLNPSSLLTSYSPIAKGVRLNKHNLVFKGDGQHPENGGVNTSRSLVNYLDVRETQEGELGDNTEPSRSRSAKSSSRQVIETIPSKISLIICQDHQDTGSMPASHLLSLSRQGQRSLFSRQQVRRK